MHTNTKTETDGGRGTSPAAATSSVSTKKLALANPCRESRGGPYSAGEARKRRWGEGAAPHALALRPRVRRAGCGRPRANHRARAEGEGERRTAGAPREPRPAHSAGWGPEARRSSSGARLRRTPPWRCGLRRPTRQGCRPLAESGRTRVVWATAHSPRPPARLRHVTAASPFESVFLSVSGQGARRRPWALMRGAAGAGLGSKTRRPFLNEGGHRAPRVTDTESRRRMRAPAKDAATHAA